MCRTWSGKSCEDCTTLTPARPVLRGGECVHGMKISVRFFYTVLLQMHARFVRFFQGRHLLNGFVGLLFRCEGGSE